MRCVSVSRSLTSLLVVTVIATLLLGGDYCFCAPPADSLTIVRGLKGATAFCVTPSGGIYVLEPGSDRLLRFSARGKRELETGGFGWGEGGFDRPRDIAALNDLELFVSDLGNDRIVRLDRTLGLTSVFETRLGNATFRFPLSLALTEFGKLLVVDGEYGRIIELGKDDRISRIFGGSGTGRGFLRKPVKVRGNGNERVLVRDESGIVVFDRYGNYIRTIGEQSTGRFIAFDLYRDGVILLDSASVRTCSITGETLWQWSIPATDGSGARAPVDVRTNGEWIYILYPDRIVRMPGGGGEPRKP